MINKGNIEIGKLFDRVSPVYDTTCENYFSYFGNLAVELSQLKPDSKILDIATGKGAVLNSIYNKLGKRTKLYGIDISPGMLDQLRGSMSREQSDITNLDIMDAEYLRFEDCSFDYIFCNFAIFFFSDYQKALSEAMRVLKDGGQILYTTFKYDKPDPDKLEESWYQNLMKKYIPRDNKPRIEKEEKKEEPDFCSVDGMKKVLSDANFRNIKVLTKEKTFHYKDEFEMWESKWTHASLRTMERIPKDRVEDFKREYLENIREEYRGKPYSVTIEVIYSFGEK